MKYTKLSVLLLSLILVISCQSTVSENDASTTNSATDEYCAGLLQRIEDMKGRPLRLTAARERYKLECSTPYDYGRHK